MIPSILFSSLLIFLLLRVPIAAALGLSTALAVLQADLPLTLIVQRMVVSNDSFPLMAIPFFILAGNVMTYGGVSRRIVAFADTLVGWMTGGLGLVATVSGVFFSAISGSSAATTAAVGSVLFPEMEKRGYDRSFSAAIVAAAGETGIIIPPSVVMVVYGVIAGVSIGDMFLGGFGPGLLMGLSMTVLIYVLSRKKGLQSTSKFVGFKQVAKSFSSAIWGLLMPVIILGGIYGGIFTPTEAAVVAVLWGVFVGFFIYKDLKPADLPKILKKSAVGAAVIMFIMNAAGLFSWIITSEQIPHKLAESFVAISGGSEIIFLMLINVLLLITGTMINASAAITILAPILVPVAMTFNIDLVFFGVLMVVNMAIGCITPPVGVDLFVATTISGVPIEKIAKSIFPFLIVLIVDLLLITYVQDIVMWLPNMFGA
ncbi:TRAP transporter large permease [Marispirochaeta sp.]|uniref:TRAP transporter large permease n=1 Tax=Marispirochaeta sp. TaxID=2038653 RepID=UPI0029C60E87|nr:TRAP transporter large permease [Marispirochaeta sp.]